MAYPVSSVPDAVAYLTTAFKTQLSSDPNPGNITLFIGNDPGLSDTPDLVGIVNVTRTLEHFAMVGDGQDLSMYEKYAVYVRFACAQRAANEGAAAAALAPRVWQLLAYCEYAVRLDPTLGGAVLSAWPGQTEGGLVEVAPDDKGWICELSWKVDIEATQ